MGRGVVAGESVGAAGAAGAGRAHGALGHAAALGSDVSEGPISVRAGLAALSGLAELRLSRVCGLDALLACLHADSARTARLELGLAPRPPLSARLCGPAHPTPAAVRALIGRAPRLWVRLIIAPSAAEWLQQAQRTRVIAIGGLQGDGDGDGRLRAELEEQWSRLQRELAGVPGVTIVAQSLSSESEKHAATRRYRRLRRRQRSRCRCSARGHRCRILARGPLRGSLALPRHCPGARVDVTTAATSLSGSAP